MSGDSDVPGPNWGLKEEHLQLSQSLLHSGQALMEEFFGEYYNILVAEGWKFSTHTSFDAEGDKEGNDLLCEALGIMAGEIKKELDQIHIAVMEGYEFVIFCLDKGEDNLEIDSRSGKIHDISIDFPSEVLKQISLHVSGLKI